MGGHVCLETIRVELAASGGAQKGGGGGVGEQRHGVIVCMVEC